MVRFVELTTDAAGEGMEEWRRGLLRPSRLVERLLHTHGGGTEDREGGEKRRGRAERRTSSNAPGGPRVSAHGFRAEDGHLCFGSDLGGCGFDVLDHGANPLLDDLFGIVLPTRERSESHRFSGSEFGICGIMEGQ
jgi:hypothetical protein